MTRGLAWRIAATAAATAVVIAGVYAALGGAAVVKVAIGPRPITFLEPAWFYLLALAPAVFLVRAFSLTDVSLAQQLIQAGLRTLVVAAVATALARPVWIDQDDKVATVVLVDVSESVSDGQLAAAAGYVEQLQRAAGERDRVFAVTFAERPRRAELRDGRFALDRHPSGGAGTNVQAAIQLAYGLFPPGYLPRLVILSDGNETEGDLLAESYRAGELGVRVSWQAFPADAAREIRVAGLRLPDDLKVGAPYEITADIWSTHPETVTVTLTQDEFPNGLEPSKTVELHEGVNKVAFKSQAKRAGFTTYRLAVVAPKGDTERANNESVMTAPVAGRPRILYVEGGELRGRTESSYLAKALTVENMDVEVRGPRGLPSSAKELEKFDAVIVSDVPAHFLGLAQMQALESYVRDLGGGFIMAGGEDSFGSGGYQGTRIEKILPVRFDSERTREQPNVAIALVIDRSGSMHGPSIEMAKQAARATAEVLAPTDLITVIAFDNSAHTIVRLQRASNRMRIATDISRLTAQGGTNIYLPLNEAYQVLQGANARVKHVILLSDGQASADGIAELCKEMRSAGITVSAVGIGGADRSLLQMIVDNGEGRLYMVEDLGALPRIFTKETKEAQKSALVEDNVIAYVHKRAELIEGTGVESAPPLRGYVSTKPKPTSDVILISNQGEPLLARWRLGTGTTVAWTSDVKNRWSTNWLRWKNYPKFWAQVVRSTMRRKVHTSYDLYASVVDGEAQIVVDAVDNDDRFVNGLDTELEIVDPRTNETVQKVAMPQTAAGRYEARFAVDRYGSYLLKAVHRRDGQVVAESLGAVALPYPAEYLRSTVNDAPLRQAALITRGLDAPAPAAVFDASGESIRYTRDLAPWVLLAAACLLLLDLYFKRLRVLGYRAVKFQ